MASSRPAPPPPPPQPQIDHLLSQFPITPKPDPDGPTPVPDAAALMLALTPELCDALHRELDPSPDDDPYFARCLRQSQLHLEALAARLHAPSSSSAPAARVPPPPPPPLPQKERQMQPRQEPGAGAGGSKSSPSGSKKRARGITEVVRATRLSAGDHLRYRALVRRARLTFEALRGAYQREETSSGARNRHDLRASSQMLAAGHWLHREVRFVGDIPGVQVGDAFYYRAEICVVGLHTAPQAGIGWIPGSHFDEGHPIATSIVSSGGYMDDEDTGDVLYYTGSGGRQRNRLDHHSDQTLERGNLALHNSYQFGVEVRVIRGHDIDQGPHRKVYVYDGLYRVVESTFGPGKSGHDVCKFKLVRLPGQDELASKTWHTAKLLKADMDNRIRPRGYISLDLSKGAEVLRVPVCNKLDKDRDRSPLLFEYTVRPEFPVPPPPVKQHRGCHCTASCGSKCRCERKNGGGPVYTEDETLVMGRPVVYECGAQCGCPMTCVNRVTQRGMKHRLEVFRSNETGWGVRALDLIQPGAFVCEYTGQVVAMDGQPGSALMEGRSIINPRTFPERWREWGDASAIEPDMKMRQFAKVAVAGPGYVLDVSQKRNVACYISHSCTPNVFLQYVLRGNENESFPHLMVFAMETIPPMRELSIDYGIDGDLIASLC